MSAFLMTSGGNKSCITIRAFEKYLGSDPALNTSAKMDAYVAKVNYSGNDNCIDFTEFARWMKGDDK